MKTLVRIIPILIVGMLTFSCSDDDEDAIPLEGTLWTLTNEATTGCADPADNETESFSCTDSDCSTIRLASGTITFTDIEGGVTDVETGTYSINGSILEVTFIDSGISFTVDVNYVISGNTLTVTLDESDFGFGGSCVSTSTYVGS